MSPAKLIFDVTPLTPADLPAAEVIEQAAYTIAPPAKDYHQELQNLVARYLGLRLVQPESDESQLIGVAGCWLVADELQVMTIAVDPAWQRLGLGKWLLHALLETGLEHGSKTATLEVRPSNLAARAVYHKYGFDEVGCRPAYYADGEDALILTRSELDSPVYRQFLEARKEFLAAQLRKIKGAGGE